MIRLSSLIAALVPLAAGCIVYEDRNHGRGDPCDDCTIESPAPDEDPVPEQEPEEEPEPEGPVLTDALVLSVSEGMPGQSLLSTLTPISQDVDLGHVVQVKFERDVEVVDTIVRPFEIVLLLHVAGDAALGDVAVNVETDDGPGFVLAEPFAIYDDGTAPTGTAGCP